MTRADGRSAGRTEAGALAGTMSGVSTTSAAVPTSSATLALDPGDARVPELSYFFPAHDEAENIEALVEEALATLPSMADRFEIVCVDDGSTRRDRGHRRPARRRAPRRREGRPSPSQPGYGAAVRSGFAAARYPLVCFTDGDRQFRVADIGRLLRRLDVTSGADVVVGYRLRRADPPLRLAYARVYRLACVDANAMSDPKVEGRLRDQGRPKHRLPRPRY